MITVDSPIIGTGGEYRYAMSYAAFGGASRIQDVTEYLTELERLCKLVGFDFRILSAQAILETAGFKSLWWQTRLNPCGLGVTGDPAQDAASPTFATGIDAARAHVVHMWAYAKGSVFEHHLLYQWALLDPRYQAVFDAGFAGTVRKLGDLGNGKWATDVRYAEKVAGVANRIFTEGESMPFTPVFWSLATDFARFGLTQAEAARILDNKFVGRRDGSIQGRPTHRLCHIQAGTTVSSLDWWANGPGVQASSTVMIQRDGSILRIIPEADGPWTNGDDGAPKPAGQALVNQPGNSNIWTLSIEAEGMTGADVLQHPAQMDSIEWQLRDWAKRYPETAPMDHLLEHADVQRINKPNCAGAYYPVIRQRLAGPVTPTFPDPAPWPTKRGEVGIKQIGEAKVRLITCEVECTRKGGAIPRATASGTAKQTSERIPLGGKRVAIAHITMPNGTRWLAVEGKTDPARVERVGAQHMSPKLPAA